MRRLFCRFVALPLVLALFAACSSPKTIVNTIKEIHVDERTDSVFIDRWHTAELRHDTMYIIDSVWYSKTILVHDSITIHDTLTIEKSSPPIRKSGEPNKREKAFIIIVLMLTALVLLKNAFYRKNQ